MRERQYRKVLKKYHALVDKTFLDGISEQEAEEKERLGKLIDDYWAPFYEPILTKLRTKVSDSPPATP